MLPLENAGRGSKGNNNLTYPHLQCYLWKTQVEAANRKALFHRLAKLRMRKSQWEAGSWLSRGSSEHNCDPPARNDSHCYPFTFWVQPLSQRGVPCIDLGFSTKSVSTVFSTSEKYTCYTHRKFISVISKCLKQATLRTM